MVSWHKVRLLTILYPHNPNTHSELVHVYVCIYPGQPSSHLLMTHLQSAPSMAIPLMSFRHSAWQAQLPGCEWP